MRASTLRQVLFSVAPLFLVACTVIGGDDDSATGENAINPNSPNAPQTKAATDVGCGGTDAPACAVGKKCLVGKDCDTANCQDGICSPPGADAPPPPATHDDGQKNGDETDVDCGGTGDAPRCAESKACGDGSDCESLVCGEGVCKAATATDAVKNGDESDVDCGGTTTGAPKCDVGKACKAHADCGSDGCGYDGKCALARSCTGHLGGDTCGSGEVGEAGAKHGSCCATASLPGSSVKIDKYLITAGRMRTMIERLNGNVRGFVQTLPANKWNQSWNTLVPANKADADEMLGSYWTSASNAKRVGSSKRSCQPGQFTGRTYWTKPTADDYSDFTQDQLDVKALNCVGWHLVTAFCAWDGGRMGTGDELARAYTNGRTTQYPWGWHDNRPYTGSTQPKQQDPRLNHYFSYNYPNVPNMRVSGGNALDIAYHVAPPGRNPEGWNAQGVEIAGNLLTWTRDAEYFFTWNFSWEEHTDNNLQTQTWLTTAPLEPNGYYGIGGRCFHD